MFRKSRCNSGATRAAFHVRRMWQGIQMDGQSATTSEIGVRQITEVALQDLHENVLSPIRADQSHELKASLSVIESISR